MERVSSLFFMLSLIMYYIPKLLKMKKSKYMLLNFNRFLKMNIINLYIRKGAANCSTFV